MGELGQLNERNKLALWAERVAECRNSGQSVLTWCKEHGICSQTYYKWQRQTSITEQLAFSLNEAEAYAYGTKSATPEQIAVKAHERKRQSGSVTDIVSEGIPTEVVEHRLSDEERTCISCGTVMEEIGKEVRRSLQMEPARFWIREDVCYTYACKKCEEENGEPNRPV